MRYFCGDIPNCREKARENPSCESNTKSNATSITLVFSSRNTKAALDSLSARRYANGDLPVSSLKILALCHWEYPAAFARSLMVMGS